MPKMRRSQARKSGRRGRRGRHRDVIGKRGVAGEGVMRHTLCMSKQQDDRGVQPESEEIILTGEGLHGAAPPEHVKDGLGNPAAAEDDMAGD